MELQIPSCALRGLDMDDIIFNSGMEGDCGATKNDNGTYFNWKISYNDCGTIRNVKSYLITINSELLGRFIRKFASSKKLKFHFAIRNNRQMNSKINFSLTKIDFES